MKTAPASWAELRWEDLPGPSDYHPAAVEPALTALAAVENDIAGHDAYNRLLFAVGNNHAGVLYPAAVPAIWRVCGLLWSANPHVRRAAANVLVELSGFEPDESWFARVTAFGGLGGRSVIAAALASNRTLIEATLNGGDEDDPDPWATKTAIREVLEQLDDLLSKLS